MIQHRIRIGNIFGPVINWANGFNFELQHSTVIQKHRDAVETRESLWVAPRFSMDFRGVFMGTDAEDFISDFQRAYDSISYFALPFRMAIARRYIDEFDVFQSDRVQFPNGIPFWAVPGSSLILQTDQYRELAHITAVDVATNTVIFDAATVSQTAHDFYAFSAVPTEIESDGPIEQLSLDVYQMRCRIRLAAGYETFAVQPYVSPADLSTRPLFLKSHNWRDSVSNDLKPNIRRSDLGVGRRYSRMYENFVSVIKKQTFMFTSHAEFEQYLSFICEMKGMRKSFWYPDYGALLDYAGIASSTRFYTTNQHLGINYAGSRTHRNIFIKMLNGDFFARQITTFNGSTAPYYVGFANLPYTMNSNNLERATWLTLNRLATDEVQFDFKSSVAGELDMSFQLLPTNEVQ